MASARKGRTVHVTVSGVIGKLTRSRAKHLTSLRLMATVGQKKVVIGRNVCLLVCSLYLDGDLSQSYVLRYEQRVNK